MVPYNIGLWSIDGRLKEFNVFYLCPAGSLSHCTCNCYGRHSYSKPFIYMDRSISIFMKQYCRMGISAKTSIRNSTDCMQSCEPENGIRSYCQDWLANREIRHCISTREGTHILSISSYLHCLKIHGISSSLLIKSRCYSCIMFYYCLIILPSDLLLLQWFFAYNWGEFERMQILCAT